MMDLFSYKLGKKAGGGGGVTSWDNITDKPSYLPVIDTSSVDILPETQLIYDEGGQQFFYMDPIEGIKVGNTYIITYNGVEYTCEAIDFVMSEMPCIVFGNQTGDENGPPFAIIVASSEMGAGLIMMVLDGATEATLAIRDAVAYTKKLDNSCLDLDWMPIKKTQPRLEEMVVAHEAVIGDSMMISEAFSYEVSFDGVMYYLPGIYRSIGAVRTERYLGNRKLYDRYTDSSYGNIEDTDEPFLIRSYLGPDADTTTVYAADGGEHTISISILLNNINKMPECYLPESVSGIVIRSSTLGSTKKFKLTVDDSGTVTAKEV